MELDDATLDALTAGIKSPTEMEALFSKMRQRSLMRWKANGATNTVQW